MIGHGATLTIRRDAGRDKYGDPGALTGTPIEVANCAVAPQVADGIDDRGRDGAVVGYTVYAPPGADIQANDRHVEIDGITGIFRVDGEPGIWNNPYSGVPRGVQVALTRAEG